MIDMTVYKGTYLLWLKKYWFVILSFSVFAEYIATLLARFDDGRCRVGERCFVWCRLLVVLRRLWSNALLLRQQADHALFEMLLCLHAHRIADA